jgi:hypothetical protein
LVWAPRLPRNSLDAWSMHQAMLKHARGYPVRVVRTTYGEHEQIMRGRRRRSLGAVTGPIKICRWPGLSGSAGLPWRQQNDLETLKSILVSSSRLVSLFETASYFRRSKGAIRMLFGHRRRETRLMSRVTVSCNRFIVPRQDGAPGGENLAVLNQLNQVCRRRVLRRPARSAFERSFHIACPGAYGCTQAECWLTSQHGI